MREDVRLADYRPTLSRSEEISVGAYARSMRRRRMLVALSGAALLVIAGITYLLLRPAFSETPAQYPVLVRCIADKCGFTGEVHVQASQAFPVTCPQCGQRSCRALWRCNDCAFLFLPDDGRTPMCPKCRSQRVGSAATGTPPTSNKNR